MQYTNLGNTDLHVSRLALGLGFRGQSSEREAQRLIEHAIASGINFIDCANKYRLRTGAPDEHGSSEEILGRVLVNHRQEVVITTKVGAEIGLGFDGGGGSKDNIIRQAEQSLRRLRTDTIDLYLLHVYDHLTPLEETYRALDELVSSGKVRHIGCCNYQAWQLCKALWTCERLGIVRPVCAQNNYSLLNRQPEREMLPFVGDQQLGLMAYSPLAVGLLSGNYHPGSAPPRGSLWDERRPEFDALMRDEPAHLLDSVRHTAQVRGISMPQLAINWVLAQPHVSVAISGADNIAQLDDNLGAFGWSLNEQERAALDKHRVELTIW
ncbi:MAG: aldo/keto reductase [Planctomycetota bacterium]|nr:aldo/keto reductase [Planctomycetota bacterium]